MVDLSLHLLDLMQNSAHAGAQNVQVGILESIDEDLLEVTVSDDGKGMSREDQARALDPFYTSSPRKKVGLGLPLVVQAAKMAGGSVSIETNLSGGTCVTVRYRLNHPDRQPLGDIAATIISFLAGNPTIDVLFSYQGPNGVFGLDTKQLRTQVGNENMGQLAFLWMTEEKLRDGLGTAGYRPDRGGFVFEIDGRP